MIYFERIIFVLLLEPGPYTLESDGTLCTTVGPDHRTDRPRLGPLYNPDRSSKIHEECDALHSRPGERKQQGDLKIQGVYKRTPFFPKS